MIAISLVYLQSKFELAGIYTCRSVVVRVGVYFVTETKMGKNNLEQRYAIKFCVRLGEGAADTYEKIQKTFGNDSLSRAQAFRWHEDFVNGRETAEGEPRCGNKRKRQDRRLTIRMIADQLNINECTSTKLLHKV
jgi:hypothetical protein